MSVTVLSLMFSFFSLNSTTSSATCPTTGFPSTSISAASRYPQVQLRAQQQVSNSQAQQRFPQQASHSQVQQRVQQQDFNPKVQQRVQQQVSYSQAQQRFQQKVLIKQPQSVHHEHQFKALKVGENQLFFFANVPAKITDEVSSTT